MMAALNRKTKEAGAIKLANLIHSGNGKIKLVWTFGHAGIAGNELADTAAKSALNLSLDGSETIAESDLIHQLRQVFFPKKREKTLGLTRKQQVAISRIQMGYTRIKH